MSDPIKAKPVDGTLESTRGLVLTAAGAAALERALLFGPASPALVHLELAALYDRLGVRSRAAAHRAAGGGAVR